MKLAVAAAFQAGQTGHGFGASSVAGLASHRSTEESAVKPLIYGYLRVTDGLEDDELQQLERGLEKLAEAEGFCLTETCCEDQPGYYGMFYRLTDELRRSQVGHMRTWICHVVVPSLDHLSPHPLLRDQLIMRLDKVGVRVWVVEP